MVNILHKKRSFNLKNQYGLLFDGVNEYVNIDSSTTALAGTTNGSWSFWVKVVNATAGTQLFLELGDTNAYGGLGVYVTASRVVEFFGFKTVADWIKSTTNAVITSGQWHHIVCTYAPSDAIIYIDGTAVAQSYRISTNKAVWFTDVPGIDNGRISCENRANQGNVFFLNGTIDEVALFNTNLTSAQVLEAYNGGNRINLKSHSKAANLVAYYRLGDALDNFNVDVAGQWSVKDHANTYDGSSVNMEAGDRVTGANL